MGEEATSQSEVTQRPAGGVRGPTALDLEKLVTWGHQPLHGGLSLVTLTQRPPRGSVLRAPASLTSSGPGGGARWGGRAGRAQWGGVGPAAGAGEHSLGRKPMMHSFHHGLRLESRWAGSFFEILQGFKFFKFRGGSVCQNLCLGRISGTPRGWLLQPASFPGLLALAVLSRLLPPEPCPPCPSPPHPCHHH